MSEQTAPKTARKPRFFSRFVPERRTRRGIAWLALPIVVAFGVYAASRLDSGEGQAIDLSAGGAIALLLALLSPIVLLLVVGVIRLLRTQLGWIGLGSFVALGYLLGEVGMPDELAWGIAGGAIGSAALIGGSIAAMTSTGFAERGLMARGGIVLTCVIGLGGAGTLAWWLMGQGDTDHVVQIAALEGVVEPPALTAADPSQQGTLTVEAMSYGAGTDRHRPEFQQDGVAWISGTVNAKPFVSDPKGWRGDLRKRYWGFGAGKFPLNARVWAPAEGGPYPLVLCVHGNHLMSDYSDPGYQYLGELLASRGYIFCSIDENFLNGGGPLHASLSRENDARGWMLLKHVEAWREWNQDPNHRFHGRVDLDNIGLIGHSRGGEAVCHAAVFNRLSHYPDDASVEFDFALKAIVSIAPVDGQYRPANHAVSMHGVNYLTLHGSHDGDVSSFHGDRLFRRLELDEGQFKAEIYVYRANHGQFNQVWGATDFGPPRAWFLNRKGLISGEAQRQVAKVAIGGFLDATLKGQREYVAMFRDPRRAKQWFGDVAIVSRFEDPSFRVVADFEEDIDVTTATLAGSRVAARGLEVWRENDIGHRGSGRREDHAVILGWNNEKEEEEPEADVGVAEAAGTGEPEAPVEADATEPAPPSFAIDLPEGAASSLEIAADKLLVVHVAASKQKPKAKDYSVEADEDESEEDQDQEQGEEQKNENDAENEEADEDEGEDEKKEASPIDLTVELVAADGTASRLPLSRFGVILPPLKAEMTRLKMLERRYRSDVEPILQTIELPLRAFVEATPEFDPAQLRTIRLVFDRTTKGVIFLDHIGIAAGQ